MRAITACLQVGARDERSLRLRGEVEFVGNGTWRLFARINDGPDLEVTSDTLHGAVLAAFVEDHRRGIDESREAVRAAGADLVKLVKEVEKVCPKCGETWILLHACPKESCKQEQGPDPAKVAHWNYKECQRCGCLWLGSAHDCALLACMACGKGFMPKNPIQVAPNDSTKWLCEPCMVKTLNPESPL